MQEQEQNQLIPQTAAATDSLNLCSQCQRPVSGQFVRALGGCYHVQCFKCLDCQQVVASRFFPLQQPDQDKSYPLCERDYFRRLNLLCATCDQALRGSYITALGRKYHLEHFTCSQCSTVFGPDETYFEHGGQVYCHYHYSVLHAVRCAGCCMPILKQFVEVKPSAATAAGNNNGNNGTIVTLLSEQWHPECYMIFKSWNLRMAPLTNEISLSSVTSAEDLKLKQQLVEEKVNRIWSVLSAFEESAASCISEMLLHVSNQSFVDAVCEAANFITHVDVLFGGIDELEVKIAKYSDGIDLVYNREPKMLAKKIVNFFSLLSHSQDTGLRQYGAVTQDLLALVTGLAQYMKILIRIALAGALKLERKYNEKSAIGDLLNRLLELAKKESEEQDRSVRFDHRYRLAEIDVKSDQCVACRNSIEDSCIRFDTFRWHKKCFHCSVCRVDLVGLFREAGYAKADAQVLCLKHFRPDAAKGFENVTQLQQYTFLLRVALKRLYSLLKIKDDSSTISNSSLNEAGSSGPQTPKRVDSPGLSDHKDVDKAVADGIRKTVLETAGPAAKVPATDVPQGRNKVEAMSKQESIHNLIEGDTSAAARHDEEYAVDGISPINSEMISKMSTSSRTGPIAIPKRPSLAASPEPMGMSSKNRTSMSSSLPNINENPLGAHAKDDAAPWPMTSPSPIPELATPPKFIQSDQPASGGRRSQFMAELSALEYFIVRHVAVLKMQPLVTDHYTVNELLDVIRNRKTSFWHKLFAGFKVSGKKPKDGVFGVPLDVLTDRSAVDSKHGCGGSRLKIPAFVDLSISALKSMDLRTEGIFRKNGNIRNLKILEESIDRDPWSVDLSKENPIQIAALLKKFLRDMPEPLLTFKLYKLFILSQKMSNPESKKKLLHYTCCLLPKPNRDLLEVLLAFLRVVASNSTEDQSTGLGNKMDVQNLATVIAPNILYQKSLNNNANSGNPSLPANAGAKDESFLGIDVLKMLIQHQDDLWMVPEDISALMTPSSLLPAHQTTDLSSKDVLKRYEHLLNTKKVPQQVSQYNVIASATDSSGGPDNAAMIPLIEDNSPGVLASLSPATSTVKRRT